MRGIRMSGKDEIAAGKLATPALRAKVRLAPTALFLLAAAVSCTPRGQGTAAYGTTAPEAASPTAPGSGSADDPPEKIVLADQYGLAYAPVAVARLKGFFDEELPGTRIDWKKAGNAAVVREAMLAGKLDGGFMGIPPYLIAKDKGMPWTAVAAVAEAELGLATVRPGLESLEDIPPDLRIALPQPGSIQHILLAMASERLLGDAGRFDAQLVTLSHPDGMSALLSGTEVEAHFTSPPFLQEELASGGARLLLDGEEAFGGRFTFIVAVLSDELIRDHPETAEGLVRALSEAAEWLNGNPGEAASLLSGHYSMDAAVLEDLLESDALEYGGEIRGMDGFDRFMRRAGYLSADSKSHG